VELMAALMSHVGAPRNSPAVAAKNTSTVATPLARSKQTTIASLVAECRLKPRAEADQCKRQICAGYWGKAEACPGRKAARTASTDIKPQR
jgi:hypothetical protein